MANITELEACWIQWMADFDKRLEAASTPSNPTLLLLADEFKAFREIVRNMLNILHQQSRDCAKTVDALDMRQRHKVLLFNGISEDINADEQHGIVNLIQEKLGLAHVSNESIKRCNRLGVQSSDRIRPVLVHFKDHSTKSEVWRSKAKLKGSQHSVSEFLTKMRQTIHKRARRHFSMKNVWTLDGVIHIKSPGGDHVKIVTEEELDLLISKYPDSVSITEPLSTSSGARRPGARYQEVRRKPPSALAQGEDSKRSGRMGPKK